ncbi:MAG: hypothetical protein S4CHLAM7_03930 [Chlamydiae bacterium]|nr:hypothetical protein [Chlamydiota bacterium]
MLDLCVSRKNKVNFADYNYQMDLDNRLLMSTFTVQDVEVLEEILYGSIRIPFVKLKKNLDLTDSELAETLQKLSQTGLFVLEDDAILVNKEMRKYYDHQILKFDDDFKPNMSYVQGLLRKVPIHILPIWYSIPRSSNNIFASMVERYFTTPQTYERYLLDLNLTEPVMSGIIAELFNNRNYELSCAEVQKKYDLSVEALEEYMLHLEFNFVCCLSYRKEGNEWRKVITPFHEWKEYLLFKQVHTPQPIENEKEVVPSTDRPFHFIQDMTYLLEEIIHQPLALQASATDQDFLFPEETVKQLIIGCSGQSQKKDVLSWQLYFSRIASRLVRIGLAIRHEEMLCPHHQAPHWLNMEVEDKALYLYRHPENRTLKMGFNEDLDTERNVREVEKGLERIQTTGWISVHSFLEGMICPIGNNESVQLVKEGPHWKYKLPSFDEEELQFMSYVILQRLYEVGMVAVGSCDGKDCFSLLPFGKDTLC